MRQTKHNQSFLVRLTFGDLPEDEIAKGFASLTKLAMIAILELLEHAHGALNSGRRDDFFNRIGHGRINYGVESCSNRRLAEGIHAVVSAKRTEPLKLIFVAAGSAASAE